MTNLIVVVQQKKISKRFSIVFSKYTENYRVYNSLTIFIQMGPQQGIALALIVVELSKLIYL